MVRFSEILVTYFVIGAVMWGGGVITWSEAGVADHVLNDPESEEAAAEGIEDSGIIDDLEKMGGPIGQIINTVGGALVAVWGFLSKLIGFVFWPVTALVNVGAPNEVVVVLGGSMCVAFIGSVLRLVRGSA